MSTVAVVPTVEPSSGPHDPPRVRLDVTDSGSPALFAVNVTRLNPDGRTVPVRTPDGNALTLSTSGSTRMGLVYDYEAPFGQPVTYSTLESPATVSVPVTVDEQQVWLIHPGIPELSMPVELRAGSLDEESWDIQQGVFWPMGRETPVVQTDGLRKAASTSVTVAVETLVELQNLKALLSDSSVLLLNIPVGMALGFDTSYVSVGAVRNKSLTGVGGDPYRAVELPLQVVDRPAGGTQAERTYTDILVGFTSYTEVMAEYGSYFDLLAGP